MNAADIIAGYKFALRQIRGQAAEAHETGDEDEMADALERIQGIAEDALGEES